MRGGIEERGQIFTEPIEIKWFLNAIVTSRGQSSCVIAWSAPTIECQNLDLISKTVFTNAASSTQPIEQRQATSIRIISGRSRDAAATASSPSRASTTRQPHISNN